MKDIAKLIETELDIESLLIPDDGYHLRQLVETCFIAGDKGMSREHKAAIILTELFARLVPGFRFDRFLDEIAIHKEKNRLLTELLYHIWSSTFPMKHLVSKERFTSYLLQEAAGIVSEETLKRLWAGLSYKEKLHLLGFSFKFKSEGRPLFS